MPQEDNKFKWIVFGVFAFLILIGLVVFSTYRSSNNNQKQVDILVWGTLSQDVFNTFISKYNETYGVSLRVNYIEKNTSTIDGELVEAIATGKGPDVILVSQELEKRYLDKVYMIDTKTFPLRTFQDTFIQEANLYIQPNGIFALPFVVDPLVMYWNKDLFASAGVANPPKTWAELPSLVSKLTKSDTNANIKQSLVSFGEYRNVDNAKELVSTLIMQAGSPIVTNDNGILRSALDSPSKDNSLIPAVLAMNFYVNYANPRHILYSWNRSLPSSKKFFLSENLALYFGFSSEYNDIKEKNPNLNFDVAQIPQVVEAKDKITFGKMYGFSLIRTSPNISQAFQLISILTSKDVSRMFSDVSGLAPVRRDLIAEGTLDPIKSVFFNSALISKGWIDPDMVKTDLIFKSMIENISTGRMGVEESVQDASKEIDNLL